MKMFYQQFLAFFLMITITLLTLGMTFLGLSRSMFYQNTWDRLQDYAYAVKTQAMDIRQGNDSKVVVDKKKLVITEQMLSGRHIKIRIYTEPDKLIFPDSKKATTKISSQCWAKLKRGQSVRAKTRGLQGFFKGSDRQLTNIYEPYLDIKGNLMAVVSVGTVMNGIEDNLKEIKQNLLYAFFTAVVLGTIVSFVLTHYFTNRITKIQRATRQVANGNFDVQIDTYHHDELDDLAEDFNLMTQSLKESQVEIERQEQRRHELMANAAHEMRTPLTTINGLLEGMAYGALPEEDQEQCINLMRKETTRLIRLVNENLDYEKSRSGELVLAKTNSMRRQPLMTSSVSCRKWPETSATFSSSSFLRCLTCMPIRIVSFKSSRTLPRMQCSSQETARLRFPERSTATIRWSASLIPESG